MFKGREVIGKPVISYDVGERFDVVKDLVFDQESNQLLGFLVRETGWFTRAQVLDLLLNSVYTEKPQLSLENLRAPQEGTAAL